MMVWLVCENLVSYASFQAFIFIDYCESSCYEQSRGDNRMKTVDWREYSTLKVIIMPNREERSWRHYSINVTGGCLTNIIQSFSQLDLQIFFTVPKGHNCKKQPLNWQIEIPSRNLSTIESTAIVPQIDVTLLSLLQFPVVIFVILLSKRSSYWQTIRRPLPAPVLSPARFFLVCLSFWPSQLDTVPNEVSLLRLLHSSLCIFS